MHFEKQWGRNEEKLGSEENQGRYRTYFCKKGWQKGIVVEMQF